jgi:hypothetical protein
LLHHPPHQRHHSLELRTQALQRDLLENIREPLDPVG